MRALIVFESHWGNTKRVAEGIAEGFGSDAQLVAVDDAPSVLPADLELLVVGGPTHAFAMSRPQTREEARTHGGIGTDRGVREWLETLVVGAIAPRFAVFGTKQGHSLLSGSAAKSAAKASHTHGLDAEKVVDFHVTSREGPLERGEYERAVEWGAALAR